MPRYTRGALTALVALTDGDVSAAAELIGADEDYLQSAIDGRQLPRAVEKEIERGLEDYRDEHPEHAEIIERVGGVLDWYPELIEIIDNDGVAEALTDNPEFVDIFYKDPTVYVDDNGERKSGGGLYPGAITVIVDWATKTKQGTERRRQRDLSGMIEALRADGFEIGDVQDSKFWEWFRGIYPG